MKKDATEAIKELNLYFFNDKKNGLLLIPFGTGVGKTFGTIRAIKECVTESKTRFYFVTTKLKNLPEQDEIPGALKLEANTERAKAIFKTDRDLISRIDQSFTDCGYNMDKDFGALRARLKDFEEETLIFESNPKTSPKEKNRRKKYLDEAESKLRTALKDCFKTIRENIELDTESFIRSFIEPDDAAFHWLGEMYPAVYFPVRQVVIMSAAKMIHVIDPILEPRISLCSGIGKYVKDAVFILDEFDDIRETIMNHIIDKIVDENHAVDLVGLYEHVVSGLRYAIEGGRFYALGSEHEQEIQDIYADASELWSRYSMASECKTDNSVEIKREGFIYRDNNGTRAFEVNENEGKKTLLVVTPTKEDSKNRISFRPQDEYISEDSYNLEDMIDAITEILKRFYDLVDRLALLHMKETGETSIDYAVSTILESFGFAASNEREGAVSVALQKDITAAMGMFRSRQFGRNPSASAREGFSFYILEDSNKHSNKTKIQMYAMNETPESYILPIAKAARVVGISATATYENLKNFDLSYFKKALGDDYIAPNHLPLDPKYDELYSVAEEDFRKQEKIYEEKIHLHVQFMEESSDEDEFKKLLGGTQEAFKYLKDLDVLLNRLNEDTRKSSSEYYKTCMFKLFTAYDNFIKCKLYASLTLAPRYPREGDPYGTDSAVIKFSAQMIRRGFGLINAKYGLFPCKNEGDKDDYLFILRETDTMTYDDKVFFATPKCRKLQNKNVGCCICIFQSVAAGRQTALRLS